MLEEGKKAPAFSLPSDTGKKIALKDLKGKQVILYFYPKDFTSGCTTEAEDFRDAYAKIKKKKAVVIGVSKDSVERHKKFRDKHDLPFNLLSDEKGDMLKAYGVWQKKTLYGKKFMGIVRSTFILDANGKVKKVFPKVRVKGHVDQVLEEL